VRWYRKAAEQGHANAQFNLGVGYANGQGVKQDHAEAVRWYRKATEQGLVYAVAALKRAARRPATWLPFAGLAAGKRDCAPVTGAGAVTFLFLAFFCAASACLRLLSQVMQAPQRPRS